MFASIVLVSLPDSMKTISRSRSTQAKDLTEWHADPEEFYHAADIGGFQENLRTCAETLYLSLFEVLGVGMEVAS